MPPSLGRRSVALLALLAVAVLAVVLVGLARSARTGRPGAGGARASAPAGPAATAPRGAAAPGTAPPGAAPATTAAAATTPAAGTRGSSPLAAPTVPCGQLVRTGEAAAVLGRPVGRVEVRDGFLVRSCLFWSGDRYVVVELDSGADATRTAYELAGRAGDRAVAGVGDVARFTPDTGLLDVLAGSARFRVGLLSSAGGKGPASPTPRLVALARAVSARV